MTADVKKVFDTETMIKLVDPAGGEHECEVRTCDIYFDVYLATHLDIH